MLNAVAAVVVADELGHDLEVAVEGVADFAGAARRFELKGEGGGVGVYDSYAHHPTEVEADLRATRAALESFGEESADLAGGRVIALFQPHLYSRTRFFAEEFATALSLADEVVVMEVYAAREDPEPGVTGELITSKVTHDRVRYVPGREETVRTVVGLARPGDIVLTMGAGDVTELGPQIMAALAERAGADTAGSGVQS